MSKANNKLPHRTIWYLRISVLLAVVLALVFGQYELFFLSLLSFGLMFLPEIIERQFKVLLPIEFDLVLVGFIYASVFLGEVGRAYERFWWWDAALHTTSGFILAYAAFLLFYILYKQGKVIASPWLAGVVVFSFAVALGAIWEIFEFAMDNLFGFSMQKSGLVDTMWDLIVDSVGALIMAYIAGRYIKHGGIGPLRAMTNAFIRENLHLNRENK